MAGSSFGSIFRITTWGESHGAGLGVVVDGCPAGLPLCEEDIQIFLNRRKPGQSKFATPRKEDDTVEILSGVFEGKTTGTPISMLVRNTSQRSRDYSEIASYYRPGHADYTFDEKYGFRDYRGGGRSSGRETIGRVAAGAVASKLLATLGISLTTYTRSIGPVTIKTFDRTQIEQNKLYMPDADAAAEASAYLLHCMKEQNSSGGIVECIVNGLPTGLGDPVFEKLDANLGKAILSIGAVKAFEIGDGMAVASATGRSNNDPFLPGENGAIRKASNHAGGVLGGISDGSPLILRAAIGPVTIKTFDRTQIEQNKLYMPDADAAAEASAYLLHCMKEQNSSGGIVECIVNGLPTGLGDPVFEKLDANLGKAILSIGAVKAFEIGDGMAVASATGRSNNDPFLPGENGAIRKASNHAGGVLGGISDGSPLILRAAIKPTPSIASFQDTVNKQGKPISVSIKGRHDPIIVPRAVVVVESMTALVLADALLLNMTATMDNVKKIYTDK